MPDTSGAVTLDVLPIPDSGMAETPDYASLPPEIQADLEKMAEANPPEDGPAPKTPVFAAFVVVMTLAGDVQIATLDAADKIDPSLAQPTEDLVMGMAAAVQKDIISGTTAQATVQYQMAQARAMQEQMQAAQIAQSLDLGKGRH